MPDPDGYAKMDGPEEATRESARPEPRFRGRVDEDDNQILRLCFTRTLLPSESINTPADATERASRDEKIRVFFSFLFKFLQFVISF